MNQSAMRREERKGERRMNGYEICAVILVSGLTAHLVSCYEMVKARKMLEGLMDDYAKELVDIAKRKFLESPGLKA